MCQSALLVAYAHITLQFWSVCPKRLNLGTARALRTMRPKNDECYEYCDDCETQPPHAPLSYL